MTQTTELAVPAQQEMSPMGLIQLAVSNGAAMDTVERLVALQTQMMAREAEKAFSVALHSAQSEMRRIGTDGLNKGISPTTRYATFAKVDGALRPIYSKHGFSLSFDTEPSGNTDVLRVVCYVRHIGGHSSVHKIDMPADGKGSKGGDVMTKTHATGSAFSYGKRYLELGIFNVTTGETDDDGNAASGKVAETQLIAMRDNIGGASTVAELRTLFETAYSYAGKIGDKDAQRVFVAAKDARKKELSL